MGALAPGESTGGETCAMAGPLLLPWRERFASIVPEPASITRPNDGFRVLINMPRQLWRSVVRHDRAEPIVCPLVLSSNTRRRSVMLPLKRRLLSTTFLPLMVGMGLALSAGSSSELSAQSQNPCAAKKPVAGKAACNPCAVSAAAPCNPCAASDRTYTIREGDSLAKVAALTYGDASLYRMLADYNGIADPDLIVVGQVISIPANPCAAQKVAAAANPCNPCNPCAAKNPCAATNPCNPCAAANPCNPCNPCAPAEAVELTPAEASAAYECIKGALQAAYTGQLQQASANPCNPCAAANPCNPCAAANPCNPCNPCAATQAVNPCNPCAANPCAAANPCNPCNPCAVIKPANPCAANPCNPCAANPCNPCGAANPCKPGAALNPCNPQVIQAAAGTGELATLAQEYQGWERL